MKDQDEWIKFEDLDFNDPNYNVYSIDTRDFHCGYRMVREARPDFATLKRYPTFFFTEQEVRELITRLFEESGGEGTWRYLDLDVRHERVNGWQIKYIRIWKTPLGFLVCNSHNEAIKKEIWANKINEAHLNFIPLKKENK